MKNRSLLFVGEDFKEGFNEKMKEKICIAPGLLRNPGLSGKGIKPKNRDAILWVFLCLVS